MVRLLASAGTLALFTGCVATAGNGSGQVIEDLPWLGDVPDQPGCVVSGATSASFGCWLQPWTDDTGFPAWSVTLEDPAAAGDDGAQVEATYPFEYLNLGLIIDSPERGETCTNFDIFVYHFNFGTDGGWWGNQEDPTFRPQDLDFDVNQPFEVAFGGDPPAPMTLRAMARENQDSAGSLIEINARFAVPGSESVGP